MLKRILTLLGASLLLATACEELLPTAVTGVTLSETSLTLNVGDEAILVATVEPEDAFNKNVSWSTSDSFIADVYEGKVLACAPGKAIITVRTEDGGKTATCEVIVTKEGEEPVVEPEQHVTGVRLDEEIKEVVIGESFTLTATVEPEDAENKNVSWTSSNPDVAVVEDGTVTAVAIGDAEITVTTEDGGFTAVCKVIVYQSEVAVTGVSLDVSEVYLTVGGTAVLTATVQPEDATNKNVSWFTDDAEVATVDEEGVVTAVGPGETYITVLTEDGDYDAYCAVYVEDEEIPSGEMVKMEWERLPDMNVARGDFNMFVCGNDVVAVGGHVYDFDTTCSVEIFKDGAWHEANPTNSVHDMGFAVTLPDGTVMVGAGCSSSWGVGQSYIVELYNPETYSFSYTSSLSTSRTICRAALLENGQVVVSGNWYAYDSIELYTPGEGFAYVKSSYEPRSVPYVIPTAYDNAMVFGFTDNYGNDSNSLMVDRLDGEPFFPTIFNDWIPLYIRTYYMMDDARIASYSYLFPVYRYTDDGVYEYAIAVTSGEEISFMPLETAIPAATEWGTTISYIDGVRVDRNKQVAYLMGRDETRVYIVAIDYKPFLVGERAKVVTYYTDELEDGFGNGSIVLLPDGRLMMAGGVTTSNFTPWSDTYVFKPF